MLKGSGMNVGLKRDWLDRFAREGTQLPADVGEEDLPVDRSVHHQGSREALEPEPSQKRRRLPVAVGYVIDQAGYRSSFG